MFGRHIRPPDCQEASESRGECKSCIKSRGPAQRRSQARLLSPNTAVQPVCRDVCLCIHARTHTPPVCYSTVPTGLRGLSPNKSYAPSPEGRRLSAHVISQIPSTVIKDEDVFRILSLLLRTHSFSAPTAFLHPVPADLNFTKQSFCSVVKTVALLT